MKTLLLLLTFAIPAIAMEPAQSPKRKRIEITYSEPVFDSQKEKYYIRAYEDDFCIGKIKFHPSHNVKNQGFIEVIKVNHAWQGEGIGYQLFKRAIYAMLAKGYRAISWKAMGFTDRVSTADLEKVYESMLKKLRIEHNFIFAKCKRFPGQEAGKEIIPMKIIFKK